MGVLWCARSDCDNVMCDRYSHKYGYICWECFDELVEEGPDTDVKLFMLTEKPDIEVNKEGAYEKFNDIFEVR